MALLDTTVLIDLGRRPSLVPHQRARRRLADLLASDDTLFTSRINEAEFRVGPERASNRSQELEHVERILNGLVILEFDAKCVPHFARLKARLLDLGRPSGDCDTLIAAVALANGQTLVTRNPAHFAFMPGLLVESY